MNIQLPRIPFPAALWLQVRDGDPAGQVLFNRHYSKYHYADGRKPTRFVGPGERIVLITCGGDALFVWRKFKDASGQQGVNCAAFRNESEILSSELILLAEAFAAERWPGERLYTYVNAGKIKSINPGCCFKKAGWRVCGVTKKRKLVVLEKTADGRQL